MKTTITRRDLLLGSGTLVATSLVAGILFQQTATTQPGPCRDPAGYSQCFWRWFRIFGPLAKTPATLVAVIIGIGTACYEIYCL